MVGKDKEVILMMKSQTAFAERTANNHAGKVEQDGLKRQIALLDTLSVKIDEFFAIKTHR